MLVTAVLEADAQDQPLLLLAGGSNVVVSDAGFPGTVVPCSRPASQRTATWSRWPPARRGTRSSRAAWSRASPGSSACRASPGRSAPRRSRTSAPTGRRSSETVAAVRVLDRRRGEVRILSPSELRVRLPDERLQARSGPVRGAVGRLSPARRRLGPIRYAELARTLGVSSAPPRRSPTSARRCWRCGAARAWCSTPPIPTPAARARSSPTRSSPRGRGARGARRSPPWPGARRAREDLRRLAHRARRVRPRHGNPDGIAISSKHVLALTNRGAGTPRSSSRLARGSPPGCATRFGVELVPEPCSSGSWPVAGGG